MSMTKTAAMRQARSEINMYAQGRGWIVSRWDADARAYRLSHEMNYFAARYNRARIVRTRAYELTGMDACDAEIQAEMDLGGCR